MRIMDRGAIVEDLGVLGMPEAERERFEHAIQRPNGAVLVTGPRFGQVHERSMPPCTSSTTASAAS